MHVMCEPALARSSASEYVYVMTSVYLSGRLDGQENQGAAMAADSEAERVAQQVAEIKATMPGIYRLIQDKAEDIGRPAYSLVRRSLAGEPDCFFAWDKRRAIGTPFSSPGVMHDSMRFMAEFGSPLGAIWGNVEVNHGKN